MPALSNGSLKYSHSPIAGLSGARDKYGSLFLRIEIRYCEPGFYENPTRSCTLNHKTSINHTHKGGYRMTETKINFVQKTRPVTETQISGTTYLVSSAFKTDSRETAVTKMERVLKSEIHLTTRNTRP